MADDGQRWAAVKAFTLCEGTRVPKNAVLTTVEVKPGAQRAPANVISGPQLASIQQLAKTLDECSTFTKIRVHFEVPNMPHKTSIAWMKAKHMPRWKWELAWATYQNLR